MDWNNFFYFMCGVLTTLTFWYKKERTIRPYRWRCPAPGCRFRASASQQETLDKVKQSHILLEAERAEG